MIQLPEKKIPESAKKSLEEWQQEIDQKTTYSEKIAEAKILFKRKNRIGDPVFDVVKEKLTEMCQGARRCAYCEDAPADEVEHVFSQKFISE